MASAPALSRHTQVNISLGGNKKSMKHPDGGGAHLVGACEAHGCSCLSRETNVMNGNADGDDANFCIDSNSATTIHALNNRMKTSFFPIDCMGFRDL